MARYLVTAFAAAALGTVAFGNSGASAQGACAAGLENVAGTCMTRGLVASLQLRSVLANQAKIGYNLPIPPTADGTYPREFDVSRFDFSQRGNFSVRPQPASP
jgi:hypothetical protein